MTAAVGSSFCRVAKPITYDRLKDTAKTIAEVKAHNDTYDGLCVPGAKKE